MEEVQTSQEVVVPTTEPAVQETPTNSEVATTEVETPAATEEQQIPKSRFDEVYAEAKANKRQLEEVQAALAKIEESKTSPEPQEEGPELDIEAQKAIEKLLASKGLMTKKEFEDQRLAEAGKIQFESDTRELSGWAEKEGYPKFDVEALQGYAKENGIQITSKSALKAAYLAQNQEAIIAAAIKRGTTATETPKATVEKPGAATGKAPSAPASGPKTLQSRIGEVLQSMGQQSN